MKVALLGKGKTGGRVRELLVARHIPHTIFDRENPPTEMGLKGHDVIISFLAGEVFKTYFDLLVKTHIPVVTGSTGMEWPSEFDLRLKEKKIPWIYATNFSLGMNLIQQMIEVMKAANQILSNYHFSIHEVHHTKKLDSPSGTALSWKKWLGHECEVTADRIGDVVGIHELKLTTQTEEITLRHEALDRSIFAEGAFYAATKISTLKPGLHLFQDVARADLKKGIHT